MHENIPKTSHWGDTFGKIIWDDIGHSQLADCDPRVVGNFLPRTGKQVVANVSDMLHKNLQGVKESVPLHPIFS